MLTVSEYRAAIRHPLAWFDRRTRCPHCRRYLGGWLGLLLIVGPPPVVVATGRCPKCGGRVLAEPEEPPDDWPRLPTRDEYRAADKAYQNRAALLMGAGVTGGLVGCLGGLAGVHELTGLPHGLRVALAVLGMFAPPVAAVLLLCVMALRARWNESLTCGWCGELLAGPAEIVLTSGRCFYCGRTALENPGPEPHADATGLLLSRDQVVARIAARTWASRAGTGLGIAILAFGGAVVAAPVLVFDGWTGFERWLRPRIGVEAARPVLEYGPFVILLTASAIGVLTAVWWEWRARKRNPLTCPFCKEGYDPTLAVAAGRCNKCYRPVVADAVDPG